MVPVLYFSLHVFSMNRSTAWRLMLCCTKRSSHGHAQSWTRQESIEWTWKNPQWTFTWFSCFQCFHGLISTRIQLETWIPVPISKIILTFHPSLLKSHWCHPFHVAKRFSSDKNKSHHFYVLLFIFVNQILWLELIWIQFDGLSFRKTGDEMEGQKITHELPNFFLRKNLNIFCFYIKVAQQIKKKNNIK